MTAKRTPLALTLFKVGMLHHFHLAQMQQKLTTPSLATLTAILSGPFTGINVKPNDVSCRLPVNTTNTMQYDVLGGGAINETPRGRTQVQASEFDPNLQLSHLMHCLVGIHRYPNYLTRWTQKDGIQDIEKLEHALEQQLATVRSQKAELQERSIIMHEIMSQVQNYTKDLFPFRPPTDWTEVQTKIFHPDARRAIFQSKFFKTSVSLESVLKGEAIVQLDASQLESWMDEELLDVYSFRLFSNEVRTITVQLFFSVTCH